MDHGRSEDLQVSSPPSSTVAVLVGLQASGKSTFAATDCFAGWSRISKDAWPNARHRQRRQRRLLGEALEAGTDVVVDNTTPSAAEWHPLIETARSRGARIEAFWFLPDIAASQTRNQLRPPATRVPDVGLFTTLSQLERPSHRDGFDGVWIVTWNGHGGFDVTASDGEEV